MDLVNTLKAVATMRDGLAALRAKREAAYAEWEKENEALLSDIEEISLALKDIENELRLGALNDYASTGNKSPVPGVNIKIFVELEYDEKAALAWALENKSFLNLDKKLFEIFAEIKPLDFVKFYEVPRAQIATDLNKYLK